MPEIPDLEVFSQNLNKKLAGKTIQKVRVLKTKKIKVSAATLKKHLEQQTVRTIYRSGKELFIEFKNGTVISLHLMLHGELKWFEKKNKHKFTILELLFDNDIGLALTDFQGQARPTLNPEPKHAPDALSLTTSFLKKQLQESDKAIKTLLTNQDIIRGLGNAYTDEILYHAGISPMSISKKIPADKVTKLARSIKTVLKNGLKQIRKIDPTIIGGEFRDFMVVHNSKKKKSPNGAAIKHKMLNSRKTYYTSEQKLYK